MRFLTDQDVYAITTEFLRNLGHDVVTAAELGLARAVDSDLLARAQSENRIFVTRDRDFGRLVFMQDMGTGVIFLRMLPSNLRLVHQELQRVLASYSYDELSRVFVVVEPARHRVRRPSR